MHALVRRVAKEEIGYLSPINRLFFADFFRKNLEILAIILFYVFDLTVQISSAFLKESNCYIFYETVDFKSKV